MNVNIYFRYFTLGLKLGDQYCKIQLSYDQNHIYLPFGWKKHRESNFSGYSIGFRSEHYYQREDPIFHCNRFYAPDQAHTQCNNIALYSSSTNKKSFEPAQLRKLHLQLKHRSKTQMIEWIKSVCQWSNELEKCIVEL